MTVAKELSLKQLQEHLERHPSDSEAWASIARTIRRTGSRPSFLDPETHPSLMQKSLLDFPMERDLLSLFLDLSGFEADCGADYEPGKWWTGSSRGVLADDRWVDSQTGMPLRVRLRLTGFSFCWIPPGEFLMGSPESDSDAYVAETPQVQVTLAAGYWIKETPVTEAEWASGMGRPPSKRVQDVPAHLDFHEAQAFCLGVSRLEQADADGPSSAVLTIPSEGQWEYACLGGEPDVAPNSSSAWYGGTPNPEKGSKLFSVQPVAGLSPNGYGLFDTLGNAYEWCEDGWSSSHRGASPMGLPRDGTYGPEWRVVRGGCYFTTARDTRPRYRTLASVESKLEQTALRPVLAAGPLWRI